MDRQRFEQLVTSAVESLPEELRSKMDNIDIFVSDYPTEEQLSRAKLPRGHTLLGLYEGVPLTKRTRSYGMVLPDRITIFQRPIEAKCGGDDAQITTEIQRVVQHEIAHHFGIGDVRLREIEKEKGDRKK